MRNKTTQVTNPRKSGSSGIKKARTSRVGTHFTLDKHLRIKRNREIATPFSGLVEDASRKHITTYSQKRKGPLALSTLHEMARTIHELRDLGSKKKTDTNTVAIFHKRSLPTAQDTFNPKNRKVNGKSLDVSSATIFDTSKDKTVSPVLVENKKMMHFAPDSGNNHFNGFSE